MDRISLGERELGIDPNTKRTVFVKIGRYGHYGTNWPC